MKKIVCLFLLIVGILGCTNNLDELLTDSILTTGTFIDFRDNHEYKWVKIGNQIWMAENLAYLPIVNLVKADTTNLSNYYVYGYNGTDVNAAKAIRNYADYGVLYDWSAALISCPAGWHLPSDAEWKQLEIALGMPQIEDDDKIDPISRGIMLGNQMKTKSGWNSDGNGSNSSGFSGLPGGYRFSNGSFCFIGSFGHWWTATDGSDIFAWGRGLGYNTSSVFRNSNFKENGFSVRCIKD